MRSILFLVTGGFLAAAPLCAQDAKPPEPAKPAVWPHVGSDLKPEAAVKWGQLENGLRYAIMKNAEPPGRVSMRLFVDAGSLFEKDEQQGVAHFLEHMAFNGTTNFAPGVMVEYFQRLGMAFGADTNAHTGFDETVYKLELPKTDADLLDRSFQLLRDYSDGMLLLEKEIDKERGVILAEKLTRDSASYRTFVEGLKFSLPDSLVAERLPIGTEEIIKSAPRGVFLDFYRSWYTADRLAVIVVGDIDPAAIEKQIKKHFASLPKNEEPAADPKPGPVKVGRGFVAKLQAEPEMSYTSIGIESVREGSFKKDTWGKRRRNLVKGLASAMINRRFEILAKQEGSPILQGRASQSSWLDFVEGADLTLACKPENWKAALQLGEKELRRALEHGFTQAELDEAKAKLLARVRAAAERADTRQSKSLSSAIVQSISKRNVFTDPRDNLKRVEQVLPTITREQCHEALKLGWAGDDRTVFIGGNVAAFDEPEKVIAKAWEESGKIAVEPPVEEETRAWAYAEFGEPGLVRARTDHEDLGIVQIEFENGVRVNLKRTDFEAGTIGAVARFGSGKLGEPGDKPGLSSFTKAAVSGGGLAEHSADELQRILAGKTVGVNFGVAEDAFTVGGRTRPEDLELQLQLMAAQITAPGWREEGVRQFRKGIDTMYAQAENTAEGVYSAKVSKWLRGGDPRFGLPAKKEMTARTIAEAKAWTADAFENGYLELSLVGDLDVEKAIPLVAKTFGALPKRRASKPSPGAAALVDFPEGGAAKDFEFETKIPRAIIAAVWKTTDMDDIARTRRLGVLGDVFDDRLRVEIREKLGDAYSPAAYHVGSDVWEDYGSLQAFVQIKPESADQIPDILRKIAKDLVEKGVTDDEFERAMAPRLARIEQIRRDNTYWLSRVLASSQEKPRSLDWARSFEEDNKAIKKAEIEALAKEYLGPDNGVIARVLPVKGEAEDKDSGADE